MKAAANHRVALKRLTPHHVSRRGGGEAGVYERTLFYFIHLALIE